MGVEEEVIVITTEGAPASTLIVTQDGPVSVLTVKDADGEVTVLSVEPDPGSTLIVTQDDSTVQLLTIKERGPQGIPGVMGIPGPPGSAGAVFLTYPSGLILSGHRMVVLDESSNAVYADRTIPGHANRVVGMTIGASALGDDATIQTSGEITEPSWSWSLGSPIWLGVGGLLTQTVPSSGFSLIVGFPVSTSKMFIDIHEPIFLI